jgi:hypothetical protein
VQLRDEIPGVINVHTLPMQSRKQISLCLKQNTPHEFPCGRFKRVLFHAAQGIWNLSTFLVQEKVTRENLSIFSLRENNNAGNYLCVGLLGIFIINFVKQTSVMIYT